MTSFRYILKKSGEASRAEQSTPEKVKSAGHFLAAEIWNGFAQGTILPYPTHRQREGEHFGRLVEAIRRWERKRIDDGYGFVYSSFMTQVAGYLVTTWKGSTHMSVELFMDALQEHHAAQVERHADDNDRRLRA
jgi:hypothetical protein